MQKVIRAFVLAAALLVAAFFANHFGVISIPWLEFNDVPTYGDNVSRSDDAVKKVFEE